ncbi:hypothetical protein [Sphingomonas sp. PR090111-T3T-6A]|uniref:hypothetical protein n=1 Tax=Sphingomonas sp. PR090111-T3T-6A TaxID=685778 RepID=UPI00037BE15C|nr:hypothetical protein [Sphingomonas sp. PR090111-T3T-6A]
MTNADTAERLSRARTLLFYLSAALFLVVPWFDSPADGSMSFAIVWVAWAILLLAGIAGMGGWFMPRGARRLMEDEGTRANRARSMAIGYFAAIAAALTLSVLVRLVAIDMQTVIRAIVTAGIAAALISFAALERTSMQDG